LAGAGSSLNAAVFRRPCFRVNWHEDNPEKNKDQGFLQFLYDIPKNIKKATFMYEFFA
jgi:hypothetical protein